MSVRDIVQDKRSIAFGRLGSYLGSAAIKVDSGNIREASDVAQDLLDTMAAQQLCVGLAANQIDSPLSVAVISREGSGNAPLVLFNPEVVAATGKKDRKRESCMSVWAMTGEVERRSNVLVSYDDASLNRLETHLSGFEARVAQHEIDHLNGVTFVAHVADGTLRPTDLFDGFTPNMS